MSGRRTALQGCVLVCAGLEEVIVERVKVLANELGAVVRERLTGDVTHIICDKAGCSAQRAATVPVVRPTWLSACSAAARIVPATRHLLPPLTGFEIVPSGLSAEEKKDLQQKAEYAGAVFSRDLARTCTHLITATPSGRKYEFASRHGINIVTPIWLIECVRQNRLLDEKSYQPGKAPLNDQSGANSVADTVIGSRLAASPTETRSELYGLQASLALDAVCLYIPGPPVWNLEKFAPLRTRALALSAMGGATVSPRWTSFVNYVLIVSVPVASEQINDIRQAEARGVQVVGMNWLEKCVQAASILPVEKYPAPAWHTVARAPTQNDAVAADSGVIADSYIFHGVRMCMGPLALRDPDAVTSASTRISSGRGKVLAHDSSGFVTSGVPTHVMCAAGMRANEKAIIDSIRKQNELVVAVTLPWVDACVSERSLLPARTCILFSPLKNVPIERMRAQGVTVAISGFQRAPPDPDWNRRRSILASLVTTLGGRYRERMRRKEASVLIADVDDSHRSEKVSRALEWGIPVVSHRWLLDCAIQGELLGTDAYIVDRERQARAAATQKKRMDADVNAQLPSGREAARSPMPDATTISLFKRFTERLNKVGTVDCGNTSLQDREAIPKRSRSASLDAQSEWANERDQERSASQSQVIVHRDLTPPTSPKRTRRLLPPRAVKRSRELT